jgi:hypothetical protein
MVVGPHSLRSNDSGELLPTSSISHSSEANMEIDIYQWPALTVQQPWAELLISGKKTIEIRKWAPEYRGRIWLHAGLATKPDLDLQFGYRDLYRGGYIGSIRLSAVIPLTPERWTQYRSKHLEENAFQSGLLAWLMDEPRRFSEPISGRGALSLFKPQHDVQEELIAMERAG